MTETGNIISEDNKCYLFTVQNTGLVQYLPFIVNDLSVSELDNIPEDVKQFLLEMVHRVSDNFSLAVKYAEILQQLRDSGFSVKENFEEHMTKYKLER
ncbi:MAG: hypothetical protein V3G42_14160 [Oscillospiraceae bacterium]